MERTRGEEGMADFSSGVTLLRRRFMCLHRHLTLDHELLKIQVEGEEVLMVHLEFEGACLLFLTLPHC